MSKLEDNVNEILGIDKESSTRVRIADFEEPAPVPRKIDETNLMLITIMKIVEITIIILLTKVMKQLRVY